MNSSVRVSKHKFFELVFKTVAVKDDGRFYEVYFLMRKTIFINIYTIQVVLYLLLNSQNIHVISMDTVEKHSNKLIFLLSEKDLFISGMQ